MCTTEWLCCGEPRPMDYGEELAWAQRVVLLHFRWLPCFAARRCLITHSSGRGSRYDPAVRPAPAVGVQRVCMIASSIDMVFHLHACCSLVLGHRLQGLASLAGTAACLSLFVSPMVMPLV